MARITSVDTFNGRKPVELKTPQEIHQMSEQELGEYRREMEQTVDNMDLLSTEEATDGVWDAYSQAGYESLARQGRLPETAARGYRESLRTGRYANSRDASGAVRETSLDEMFPNGAWMVYDEDHGNAVVITDDLDTASCIANEMAENRRDDYLEGGWDSTVDSCADDYEAREAAEGLAHDHIYPTAVDANTRGFASGKGTVVLSGGWDSSRTYDPSDWTPRMILPEDRNGHYSSLHEGILGDGDWLNGDMWIAGSCQQDKEGRISVDETSLQANLDEWEFDDAPADSKTTPDAPAPAPTPSAPVIKGGAARVAAGGGSGMTAGNSGTRVDGSVAEHHGPKTIHVDEYHRGDGTRVSAHDKTINT